MKEGNHAKGEDERADGEVFTKPAMARWHEYEPDGHDASEIESLGARTLAPNQA